MIATTLKNGTLLVLGDILISSQQQPPHFLLPTLLDDVLPYLPASAVYQPVDLAQKIYLLKHNVCATFSGKLAIVKPFLEDLTMYCRYHTEVKVNDLENYLQQYVTGTDLEDTSILILVLEKVDGVSHIRLLKAGSWQTAFSPLVGEIMAAGSGATDFIAMTQVKGDLIMPVQQYGALEEAILTNVSILTRILAQERAILTTVKKHWGAGFEVAYVAGGAFHKLDDITYIINQGQFDDSSSIETPVPAFVLHYKYHNNTLVITVLAAQEGSTQTTDQHYIFRFKKFVVDQFRVEPISLMGETIKDNVDSSFTSTRVGMGYILDAGNGYFTPASLHFEHDLKVEYHHKKSVTITMKKEINDFLLQHVKHRFAERRS